jgi:hypothetical protein
MVLQLLLPKGVNQIALQIVGGVLEQRCITPLLPNFRVAFAQGIQTLLLRCLHNEWVDVDRSAQPSANCQPVEEESRTSSSQGQVRPL